MRNNHINSFSYAVVFAMAFITGIITVIMTWEGFSFNIIRVLISGGIVSIMLTLFSLMITGLLISILEKHMLDANFDIQIKIYVAIVLSIIAHYEIIIWKYF